MPTQEENDKALLDAASNGSVEEVSGSLLAGANVNAASEDGYTPLHRAAGQGHETVAKLLLDAGADVDKQTSWGTTSLWIAAFAGHFDIVKALLEKEADVNAANENGATPLYVAVQKDYEVVVKALLEQDGIGVDVERVCGSTPLFQAAKIGHLDVVKALLEKEANVNAENIYGQTPLHRAAEKGHLDVVKLLLARGADVNAANVDGETPLHWAAEKGHLDVARYLKFFKTLVDLDLGLITAVFVAAKKRIHEIRLALTSPEPEPELTGAGEVVVSSKAEAKDPLEQLKCIFLKRIEDSSDEQQAIKHRSDFITLALAVAQLRSYEGSKQEAAKEIIDKIIEFTELGEIFFSEGDIVGIGDVIKKLSGDNYAKVFKTTRFNRSLTTLQEVISDVSEILGGESYPDPGSFVKLKGRLDSERKSLTVAAQTDSSSSNLFHPAAATRIQSFFRGYKTRKALREEKKTNRPSIQFGLTCSLFDNSYDNEIYNLDGKAATPGQGFQSTVRDRK